MNARSIWPISEISYPVSGRCGSAASAQLDSKRSRFVAACRPGVPIA